MGIEPEAFPRAADMDALTLRGSIENEKLRLHQIAALLHAEYGTPDLGNKPDPVDELVYIILSRRTREAAYQEAYRALKRRYSKWDEVVVAPLEEIAEVIRRSGLAEKKARSIQNALRAIRDEFGSCTLDSTVAWTNEELVNFLCSLDEVGPKSALCVLLMSFGRDVFPVDAHVGRVLSRVRPYAALGLRLHGRTQKERQRILADVIPPDARKSLHINLILHGRRVCLSGVPKCGRCVIADDCLFERKQEPVDDRIDGSVAA
jgi:endonuclease III